MSSTPSLPPVQRTFNVPQLIAAMLKSREHVSDLIFSPGRAPQVEISGQLIELKFKGLECLVPHDTDHIAKALLGSNDHAARKLEVDGSADLSYGLDQMARFRVNIFRQRGSCAIVMRVIPDRIPNFSQPGVRNRLSKAFRFILSQRLLPRRDNKGRVAVLEILRSTAPHSRVHREGRR